MNNPALADILAQQIKNGTAAVAKPRVRAPIVPPLPPIVKTIVESIPDSMYEEERVHYMAEQVNSLLEKDRVALRQYMEIFVRRTVDLGASDMDAGSSGCDGYFWYRVDGDKRRYEELGTYTPEETDLLFLNLLNERQSKVLLEVQSVDFSFQLPGDTPEGRPRRFRTTCYFDNDHLALNMRQINEEIFPLKTLGFHPFIEKGLMFRHVRDGLTLVTGVTGSGKSTTLDAVIDANNEDVPAHIVIIAKPIEYMHPSKRCIVRHREVGKDVRKFKDGIVQSLRQDPDIIVIGEMRDPETISSALEITDSGHKVFSTLHTISAVETLDRIIGEYPTEEQERIRLRLADVLRCIISQKLCPKVGGGRVLTKEVLWIDASARAAIKNGNTSEIYQMMWEGGQQGMCTLEQDLLRLAKQRLITPETALDFANNKRRMQQLLR
ncbi:MAG: ATPase, T2SS/T4P/T4SS family [Rhodothermales bacterium]|nr:ATPase, T2SS/T4P/T4SS family [Rhodothermales bacterium]